MDHRISKDMISSGMIPSGEKNQEDLGKTQYGTAPSPNALSDVYKKMYETKEEVINEHHKKDADGNTIPHEGEEINEVAPLALALPALAKGAAALLSKKAIAGAALKLGSKAAAKTVLKKGVAGAAKQGLASTGKSMVKNPVNTMAGASLLKPAPKKPKPSIDRSQKMTGARTAGVYASADLFDIVKGQLLDEGIDEKDALKIMVELSQQDLNTIVNEGIGQMKLLPTVAALAGGAVATQQIASRMGKKSGEESIKPNKPNKPDPIKDLIPNLKKKKEATEKSVQSM